MRTLRRRRTPPPRGHSQLVAVAWVIAGILLLHLAGYAAYTLWFIGAIS